MTDGACRETVLCVFFFFQAEDGIRDLVRSRGLGDVYKRQAHAHEFIVQMDKGYQTNIGDRGGKMSGGQRQRISIARAILKLSLIHI